MLCLESVNVCLFLLPTQALKWVCFDFAVVTLKHPFHTLCIAYVHYVILSSVLWTRTLDAMYLPHTSGHSTFIYRMNDQGLAVLSYYKTIVFSAVDFYRIPESFDGSKDYWIEQYGFNFRHYIYHIAWSIWHTLI